MIRTAIARVWLPVLTAAVLSGCGSNGSLSGEVTYDGKPVEKGQITFVPADGKGTDFGTSIAAGKYAADNIPLGPKLVKIEAVKEVTFARSSEEMAQRAAEARAKGNATGLIDPADLIPTNAVGNNAALTVEPGKKTHDFHLEPPGGKKP